MTWTMIMHTPENMVKKAIKEYLAMKEKEDGTNTSGISEKSREVERD